MIMPSWKLHRKLAKYLGIDYKLSREIDRFLDFPEFYGIKLPHKALHNVFGVAMAGVKYGNKGLIYALFHIILDEKVSRRRL